MVMWEGICQSILPCSSHSILAAISKAKKWEITLKEKIRNLTKNPRLDKDSKHSFQNKQKFPSSDFYLQPQCLLSRKKSCKHSRVPNHHAPTFGHSASYSIQYFLEGRLCAWEEQKKNIKTNTWQLLLVLQPSTAKLNFWNKLCFCSR